MFKEPLTIMRLTAGRSEAVPRSRIGKPPPATAFAETKEHNRKEHKECNQSLNPDHHVNQPHFIGSWDFQVLRNGQKPGVHHEPY